MAVVRTGRGRGGSCGVGGDDVAVGTDAQVSDRRRRARVVGVLVGQLSDAHSVDEPVQRTRHRGAFARGMIRGTVQRVREEPLSALRLRDHLIERRDLHADDLPPLRTGRIWTEVDLRVHSELAEQSGQQPTGEVIASHKRESECQPCSLAHRRRTRCTQPLTGWTGPHAHAACEQADGIQPLEKSLDFKST